MLDWIFRRATVIDGSRKPRYVADVGIQGDRIVAIGNLADQRATNERDLEGKVLAPGFVDVHTHSDGWLLTLHGLEPKVRQGFSTEVLMVDGISYAPVTPENWRDWFFYLRALDGLPLHAYDGWRTIAEYMSRLDRTAVQNSTALVPYANVRALACGMFQRTPPDDFQTRSIARTIREEMEAGAAGLSTGLDYIVQNVATTDELVEACKEIAPFGGLYVTHMRYKRGVLPGLLEAIEIGRRAGVRVHISHLKATASDTAEQVLGLVDEARRDVDLTFDVYPYQSGSTMLNYLLPYEVWEDGPLGVLQRLRLPELRDRFGVGLDWYRLRLDSIRIAWVLSADNKPLQGMTLEQVIEQRGGRPADVLCDLLIEERLAVLMVLEEPDDGMIYPFLQHEAYMIGSDGIYFPDGPVHPRVFGSATRILGPLVRDAKLFSLEEAVYKLAAFPAARYGLVDRGIIAEGKFADLVVFDPQRVTDAADEEDPRAPGTGVELLLVNGEVAWDGQQMPCPSSGPRCGRWLRYRQD